MFKHLFQFFRRSDKIAEDRLKTFEKKIDDIARHPRYVLSEEELNAERDSMIGRY